jgi:hypothetical protein
MQMTTFFQYGLGVIALASAGLAGWANGEGAPQAHFVAVCAACMLAFAVIS